MGAPPEQSENRESNEPGEAKDVSQREVLQPLETGPATGGAFQHAEHLITELLNTIGHEFRVNSLWSVRFCLAGPRFQP